AGTVSFVLPFNPPTMLGPQLNGPNPWLSDRIGPDGLFHARELSTGLEIAPVLP
ncbi:unnamed protein product, partial [Musa textilis]